MYSCNWLIYHLKIKISSFKTSNKAAIDLLLNLLLPIHLSPFFHATFFPWNSASVCGPRIQVSLALTYNPFQPLLLPPPLCVTSCGLLEPLSIRYPTANTLGLESETPQMPYFLGSSRNHSNQRTEQPPDVNTRKSLLTLWFYIPRSQRKNMHVSNEDNVFRSQQCSYRRPWEKEFSWSIK